jgi:hypothetical protein
MRLMDHDPTKTSMFDAEAYNGRGSLAEAIRFSLEALVYNYRVLFHRCMD